jgi:hypothetical protein
MPEQAKAIQEAFHRSPKKSIWRASCKLQTPHSTIYDVVHKYVKLISYKLQLVQKLQENDLLWCYNSAVDILSWIGEGSGYLGKVCFSDEATFHISGKVNHCFAVSVVWKGTLS